MEFGKRILTHTEFADLKLGKEEFVLDALFEQRMANPVFNLGDPKIMEIVKTLGLDAGNPLHLLKSLHALKLKLGLDF